MIEKCDTGYVLVSPDSTGKGERGEAGEAGHSRLVDLPSWKRGNIKPLVLIYATGLQ